MGADDLVLRVEGLSVGHHGRPLLTGISLSVGRGECVGIAGGNGAGKTTLLRTLLGLQRPLAGAVRRGGDFRVGYLPQRDSIDPVYPFRALDVVLMGARPDAWLPFTARRERRREAQAALERAGGAGVATAPFRDLSGGQKQRVLLARALASRPSVLAMDEPTSGLDVAAEAELLALLGRLRREEGLTTLLVSHSLPLLGNECTSIVVLHGGRHREGPAADVLTDDGLTALFGVPVRVRSAGGRRWFDVGGA